MTASYEIQGRRVMLPVEVRDASSATATFLVDAATARALLRIPGLEPAEPWPGRALATLAAIDYRDNDLGRYHEVSIALFVREDSAPRIGRARLALDLLRGRVGTAILHLPVDQAFTCEAGRTIWGFPKTLQQIDWEELPGRLRCSLRMDGRHVLTLELPRGGGRRMPEQGLVTYTTIAGLPYRTRFTTAAEGVGFRPGGATLSLGDHAIADELRQLGLPRRALASVWMEHMRGRFEAPEKL